MARRKKKSKGCTRGRISFKTKRGKTISFQGRSGAACGPRKKPTTGHLRHYKAAFKAAAKHCKGKPRHAFLNCMRTQTPR